jgi:hypothetical protein
MSGTFDSIWQFTFSNRYIPDIYLISVGIGVPEYDDIVRRDHQLFVGLVSAFPQLPPREE